MAYGKKYELSFKTTQGNEYRVDVFEDGYIGSVEEIKAGGDKVTLDWADPSGFWNPLRASKLTINAWNLTHFNFSDFYNAPFGKFKAQLINVNTLTVLWTGFNVSDVFSEPYTDTPYPSKLVFTDGLGELKAVKFLDGAGAFLVGTKTWLEVIRICLNEVNPLNIVESFNVYHEGHDNGVGDSVFIQTQVVPDAYLQIIARKLEADSAQTVLKHILTSIGCQIVQYMNRWWIVRTKEFDGDSLIWREFLPAVGTESETAIEASGSEAIVKQYKGDEAAGANDVIPYQADQTLTIEQRARRFTYRHDPTLSFVYGDGMTITRNGKFLKALGRTDEGMPAYWVSENIIVAMRYGELVSAPGAELLIEGSDFTGDSYLLEFMNILPAINTNKYIRNTTTTRYVKEDVQYVSDIKAQTPEGGTACQIPVELKVTDLATDTDYYLSELGVLDTTPTTIYVSVDFNNWGPSGILSISEIIFQVPFTGFADIELTLYNPIENDIGADNPSSMILAGAEMAYWQEVEQAANLTETFYYIEEIDSFHDNIEINAFHTDLIGDADISDGTFRLMDESVTTGWKVRGSTEDFKPIWEILADDVLTMKSEQTKKLTGSFVSKNSEITPITKLQSAFDGLPEENYIVQGLRWLVTEDVYVVDAYQVEDFEVAPVITESEATSTRQLPDDDDSSNNIEGEEETTTDDYEFSVKTNETFNNYPT